MKRVIMLVIVAAAAIAGVQQLRAHCEVPCGIYDDPLRIALMREHVTTIEKSMNMIVTLSGEDGKNYNQLVRWIENKEYHADELQHIVAQYFMTQRVKPVDGANAAAHAAYVEQLSLLHQLLIAAMKSKQTTDLEQIAAMRGIIDRFEAAYLKKQ